MRVVNNTMTATNRNSIGTNNNALPLNRSHEWHTVISRVLMAFLLCFASFAVMAADNAERTLDFAEFQATPDGGVEIKLSLSSDAPTPTDFTSTSPAKISLDLPKTKDNLPWSLPLPVDTGGVTNIKAVQASDRTRVVINMSKLAEYSVRTEGKYIFVTIPGNGSASKGSQNKTASAKAPAPAKPAAKPAVAKSKPAPRRRPAPAARPGFNQLQSIAFTQLPGDKVQFKLSFNEPATEPGSFTIDNPARIALDFPNTSSGLGWKNENVGIGMAKSITAVEAGNRTRVILNLVQLIPFETSTEGRNVIVTLAGTRTASAEPSAASPQVSTAVPGDTTAHMITNIDFRRGSKGEGRIVVTMSDPNTPASTGEQGQQIFVDFGNTGLPPALQQRLDVTDFATPVQYIDATKVGNRVRLAITPSGEYEYLAYQAGDTYTIEVKRTEKKVEKKKATAGFTGEKLSLNFQDIQVRAVLQLIADFTNLNMVTSDSVKGHVTLRLKNVPWDQALDIILKTKGLGMRRTGNVILVAPSAEINAREKSELESKKQIEKLEPLKSELIQINYAKASEIAKLLKAKGTSVMSDRGSTTVDARTNNILVVDTAERLLDVRKLISKLDIPVRQVLIESRIVIASDNFAKDLGVRFGVSNVGSINGNDNATTYTSGSMSSTDTSIAASLDSYQSNGTPFPTKIPTGSGGFPQRLNVNMPISASNAGRIAFGILSNNSTTLLDLELSALQTDGRGELLSNPRVITANQKEATIQQGTQIPYQQASSSGATSVSFKQAVLSLKVTPQITPDDRIILDLNVNKDSVGTIFNGVPSIDTKAVKTQVLVDNGETVVLGGIYEQQKNHSTERVPFFGDLPWIGALFRSKHELNDKTELLIFVTPKILKQGLADATK